MRRYRWKIACVNWGHDTPGVPKVVAYLTAGGVSVDRTWQYFATHPEAVAYVDRTVSYARRLKAAR